MAFSLYSQTALKYLFQEYNNCDLSALKLFQNTANSSQAHENPCVL